MITITLMGTPIAKARARVGKWRAYTPKKSKGYSDALAWAAKKVMQGKPLLKGALAIKIIAHMPIPKSMAKIKQIGGSFHIKKPDLDNIFKQLDALNGIVWEDDSQVAVYRESFKIYSYEPKLIIHVEELC